MIIIDWLTIDHRQTSAIGDRSLASIDRSAIIDRRPSMIYHRNRKFKSGSYIRHHRSSIIVDHRPSIVDDRSPSLTISPRRCAISVGISIIGPRALAIGLHRPISIINRHHRSSIGDSRSPSSIDRSSVVDHRPSVVKALRPSTTKLSRRPSTIDHHGWIGHRSSTTVDHRSSIILIDHSRALWGTIG